MEIRSIQEIIKVQLHDALRKILFRTKSSSVQVHSCRNKYKSSQYGKVKVVQHFVQCSVQLTAVQLPSRTRASHLEATREVTAASRKLFITFENIRTLIYNRPGSIGTSSMLVGCWRGVVAHCILVTAPVPWFWGFGIWGFEIGDRACQFYHF